ncbi:MAG: hypothetical protein HY675_20360 [Chloroflexi bacterium]|nr:hypothetical protein [Chloroflexota bacterium]
MPRTITIDSVQVTHVRVDRDPGGQLHVYAEYHLKSAGQIVQTKFEEITERLSSQRRSSALQVFDSVVQDLIAQLA